MGGAPGGAGRWGGGMAARWRQDGGKIAARLHLAVHWRVGQHVRHVRVRAVELDELMVVEVLWDFAFGQGCYGLTRPWVGVAGRGTFRGVGEG